MKSRNVSVGTRKNSTAAISRRWAAHEGPPRPGGPGRGPAHVLRDGQFGDVVAEEGQLRLDAPAAPRRILSRHPANQLAQRGLEPRAADRVGPGLPAPEEPVSFAMPSDQRVRLDDDEC